MAVMAEFITMHKLVKLPNSALTPMQRRVAYTHESARSSAEEVKRSKEANWQLKSRQREALASLERYAEQAGQKAIDAALEYYVISGRAEQAYDEVRQFAKVHWAKRIGANWTNYFANALAQQINRGHFDPRDLSAEFARRLDRDIQQGLHTDALAKLLKKRGAKREGDTMLRYSKLLHEKEMSKFIDEAEHTAAKRRAKPQLPN